MVRGRGSTVRSKGGSHGAGDSRSGQRRRGARSLALARGGEDEKLELTWERMRTA